MPKDKPRCHTCGATMVQYRHALSSQLVQALCALVEYGGEAYLPDLGLSHVQLCTFQKLKYWGFVYQAKGNGVWGATARARAFLNFEQPAPLVVWSYRGEFARVDPNTPYAYAQDVPYIAGKTRAEYAQEAESCHV